MIRFYLFDVVGDIANDDDVSMEVLRIGASNVSGFVGIGGPISDLSDATMSTTAPAM